MEIINLARISRTLVIWDIDFHTYANYFHCYLEKSLELNLPILEQVSNCKSLLIAGMGGGYDVFCGLPIYFELKNRGMNVHLGNFSFSDIARAQNGIRLSPTLVGVTADHDDIYPYFPEFYLSHWFREKLNESVPIWSFHKTGAEPLSKNYQILANHLNLDGVLLIDGGVDSLMRGDEEEKGTVIEDATSLYAVNQLQGVPMRMLACIGLGAERDISYAQVFENIAALTKAGGFLGSCSLTSHMQSCVLYAEAVEYAQGQYYHDPSVINSSIVSAQYGQFGNYHLTKKTKDSHLWISPLMPLFWFFDFNLVTQNNYFLPELGGTQTFRDALFKVMAFTEILPRRTTPKIPL